MDLWSLRFVENGVVVAPGVKGSEGGLKERCLGSVVGGFGTVSGHGCEVVR